MTDMMPLFGPGSRGGVDTLAAKARKTPQVAPGSFSWERLVLKKLPRCGACVRSLHGTWLDGRTPYAGPRAARWRRTETTETGKVVTEWCSVHAELKQEQERADLVALTIAQNEALRASRPARRPYRRRPT